MNDFVLLRQALNQVIDTALVNHPKEAELLLITLYETANRELVNIERRNDTEDGT